MAEWIYFLHTPREDFAATMTPDEERVWGLHFERLKRLLAKGTPVMADEPAIAKRLRHERATRLQGFAAVGPGPEWAGGRTAQLRLPAQ